MKRHAPTALTAETMTQGLRYLSNRDPDLARILGELGPPPMWARHCGETARRDAPQPLPADGYLPSCRTLAFST